MSAAVKPSRETEERRVARVFAKDIEAHEMHVRLDQGVHRDILFKRPGSSVYHFAITTWPGHLCISGDMGSFVFARLHDMFEFFRANGNTHGINPSYWSEKLQVPNPRDATEYDADVFRKQIAYRLNGFIEGNNIILDRDLREAVRDEVLSCADDGEHAAHAAARDFEYEGETVFQDFWEVNCREYTHQFLWCCHAIVWAIAQWDARSTEERAA